MYLLVLILSFNEFLEQKIKTKSFRSDHPDEMNSLKISIILSDRHIRKIHLHDVTLRMTNDSNLPPPPNHSFANHSDSPEFQIFLWARWIEIVIIRIKNKLFSLEFCFVFFLFLINCPLGATNLMFGLSDHRHEHDFNY